VNWAQISITLGSHCMTTLVLETKTGKKCVFHGYIELEVTV